MAAISSRDAWRARWDTVSRKKGEGFEAGCLPWLRPMSPRNISSSVTRSISRQRPWRKQSSNSDISIVSQPSEEAHPIPRTVTNNSAVARVLSPVPRDIAEEKPLPPSLSEKYSTENSLNSAGTSQDTDKEAHDGKPPNYYEENGQQEKEAHDHDNETKDEDEERDKKREYEDYDDEGYASDTDSIQLYLPMQDLDGRDIRLAAARMDRPPSWEYGVPLWPVVSNIEAPPPVVDIMSPVSPMTPSQELESLPFKRSAADIRASSRESWREDKSRPPVGWI